MNFSLLNVINCVFKSIEQRLEQEMPGTTRRCISIFIKKPIQDMCQNVICLKKENRILWT